MKYGRTKGIAGERLIRASKINESRVKMAMARSSKRLAHSRVKLR